ncbi:GntR family transcriptional regulator [Pseudogracilibacillus sp. SO30301A]|uniref:GntR family transcriptional regulator n=1 Tax=Pseudogracilibacillus sp. SO30301A TaxID=3098291 RepID=UPI00300E00F6
MNRKNRTVQSKIYEIIRENIINGKYESGTKLIETKLAEEFGVSRTPVREAVQRLKQEGLIKKNVVYKPTESDLRHLFQMRILIECYAAQMAANYMVDTDIENLQHCIDIARKGDSKEIVKANKKFHDIIVRESRNPIMIDTVQKMESIIYLFSRAVVFNKRPFLIDEHQQIKQAIAERNSEKASDLMRLHLEADLEFSLDIV